MSLLQKLKKAFEIVNRGHTFFDIPVEEQEAVLKKFPDPKDDFQRSYLQYRCQNHMLRRGVPVLLNLAAIPLGLFYRLSLQGAEAGGKVEQEHDAVFLYTGSAGILPDSLHNEFRILQLQDYQKNLLLSKEDVKYMRALRRRYPTAFYFRFKCMMKLAMYSHVITRYAPRAVICSEEYSFTSSFLTDYCRSRGVEHINVMHGEKVYDLHDTFFRFDRFYVWDRHYVELFRDLRADPEQFRLEMPPSLIFSQDVPFEKTVDYTYYLGDESREHIERILALLGKLQKKGNRVAIRIHPVYRSQSEFLIQDNRGFLIEQKTDCSIEESLRRTGCALALHSTVLLQAALNGVPFMIDDISAPERYKALQKLRLISLNKPHGLLSEIVRDGKG